MPCTLIGVAFPMDSPMDRHVTQLEAEKKQNYKVCLCIERQRMWDIKCVIMPVIFGATGIVTKDVKKNVDSASGKHSVGSLQWYVFVLVTSFIIRRVLQSET